MSVPKDMTCFLSVYWSCEEHTAEMYYSRESWVSGRSRSLGFTQDMKPSGVFTPLVIGRVHPHRPKSADLMPMSACYYLH